MLGSRSGFVQLVKEKNAEVTGIHCFIHRQALAAKTLPNELNAVLKQCIKIVNYIKNSALNTRLFKTLCEDLGSDHKTLLFHTQVRWLSKGNMLDRLFDLRDEVITFLENLKQNELSMEFKKPSTQVSLAYLSNFFDSLNSLNLKLQGGESNIVIHRDAIKMYIEKLQLWKRKISANTCSYSNFAKIMSISDEPQVKEVFEGSQMKSLMLNHLENLTEEFKKYFPDICDEGIYRLSTDPFNINIDSLPEALQEEGLEIKHDSSAKYDFDKMDKSSFWIKYFKV